MKFVRHRSSLFKAPANFIAIIGYLFLSLGVGLPLVNQAAVLVCLVIFVLEKKSYLVQFHVMQAALVSVMIELLRSVGLFLVGWGWQLFGWQQNTVEILLSVVIYGLVGVQAVVAIVGVVTATRWKTFSVWVAGNITQWLLNQWPTGVKKEEYQDVSGDDGVGINLKR